MNPLTPLRSVYGSGRLVVMAQQATLRMVGSVLVGRYRKQTGAVPSATGDTGTSTYSLREIRAAAQTLLCSGLYVHLLIKVSCVAAFRSGTHFW